MPLRGNRGAPAPTDFHSLVGTGLPDGPSRKTISRKAGSRVFYFGAEILRAGFAALRMTRTECGVKKGSPAGELARERLRGDTEAILRAARAKKGIFLAVKLKKVKLRKKIVKNRKDKRQKAYYNEENRVFLRGARHQKGFPSRGRLSPHPSPAAPPSPLRGRLGRKIALKKASSLPLVARLCSLSPRGSSRAAGDEVKKRLPCAKGAPPKAVRDCFLFHLIRRLRRHLPLGGEGYEVAERWHKKRSPNRRGVPLSRVLRCKTRVSPSFIGRPDPTAI